MMAYGKDYEVSYIVSINFRANLDAQNAGNRMQEIAFPGFKFQTFSGGVCPPDPLGIHAWYVSHMAIPHLYIISQKGPFSKNAPPPTEKSLKKALISNKVVYVYCVSKAVGQTNTVPPPPPPPNKIRPVRPCGSLSPTICSNRRSRTSEGPLTVKETCPKHQLEIHHKKR